jgi:GT2 family glycosyltransferase
MGDISHAGDDILPAECENRGNIIHIVTVLYNSAAVLDRFIASLTAQRHVGWRLIAIDNASRDGCADRLAALADPRIVVLRNASNTGFARATNRGLRHALEEGGEFVVLMNNDVEFAPDFLGDFLAARRTLDAQAITPRIAYLRSPDEAWYAGGHFDSSWIFKSVHEESDPPDAPDVRTVDFASGCCLGLTRAVLERVGLLDERFFVYWEDTDYCLRLRAAGIPIHYLRRLTLLHDSSALAGGHNSPTFISLFYRGYMQILMKYFGPAYTLRAMLRLLAKHKGHRDSHGGLAWPRMLGAMVRGLTLSCLPCRDIPWLQARVAEQ